nr:ABC transporter substrate-binding protein [Actinomycetota bacterium]
MTSARSAGPIAALIATAGLALAGCGGPATTSDPNRNADAKEITLAIAVNAAQGGKNTVEAEWILDYVIPEFTKRMSAEGVKATVTFQPSGVDDEQYKTKLSLD